jgi:hypothetical protein
MSNETADGDDASLRSTRQIRQRRSRQFVKRCGHDSERPFEPRARQLHEITSIRKPLAMDDRIDAPERGARRANKLGCRPGICQVASAPRHIGAGTLTVHGDHIQSLEPCNVGPLSMQHQALVPGCQPARDRSPDPGPCPVMIETCVEFSFLKLIGQTIDAAGANANNRNGFASYRSEAAQLMRAEVEVVSVVPWSR